MLKRTIAAFGFLVWGVASSFAGNVSTVTGPNDPSQLNALINTLIVSGNTSWNPGGRNFLYTNIITAIGSATITLSSLGPSGLVTSTIVGWMKVRNPSASVITGGVTQNPPLFYLIPMWGVNGP